jgi:hypothetical protein
MKSGGCVEFLGENLILGIDIGGTKTALALVDCKGGMSKKIVVSSEAGSINLLDRIVKKSKALIADCGADNSVIGIGVGFPGVTSISDDKIVYAPNLKGWKGLDFKRKLENSMQLPVFIENDCNAAVIGEWLPKQDFEDVDNINFSLQKNQTIVQEGNTSLMLYKIDEIIEYVSKYFTLKIGDIIFTGTPEGVGKVFANDRLKGLIENTEMFSITVK